MNPLGLRIKWLNTRPRVFVTGLVLFIAFGQVFVAYEKVEEAKLKDKTPEFILSHYAKRSFGENADIWITIHNEDPLKYNIKINAFRETSISSGTLRFQFFNDVSRFMQRVAENEKLKAGTGEHLIGLKTSVTTHGGFQDTSIVVSVRLPNNLRVNWEEMQFNAPDFLKYLYREKQFNPEVGVYWKIEGMKPDYWN